MKYIRICVIILVALGVLVLLSGCSEQVQTSADKDAITVTDLTNRTVSVPENPQRVIAFGAGALRHIVYLRATDLVVGVDDMEIGSPNPFGSGMPSGADRPYSLANAGIAKLPSIGTRDGDAELIAAQNPDVVFFYWGTEKTATALQDKTGIPVVALHSGDLGANKPLFYQSLRTMAGILDRKDRAEEVIDYIDGTMDDLDQRTQDIPEDEKPRVYIAGIAFRGAHGFLSTEPDYPPLAMVNGKNVAAGVGPGGQVMIDKEKLIEWNPEVIFIDEASYALVMEDLQDPVFQSLDALKNGQVYGVLPYNWYANNYDTVLADAYFIGKTLYPDRFTDIDPEQKADEIYNFLDGKPVYPEMKSLFGGFKEL
jgi:iron complex transport system substrate-binding protein